MIRRSVIFVPRPRFGGAVSRTGRACVHRTWHLAKNLGVRGQIWAIAEPDLLTQIEARLVTLKDSGELNRLE